MTINHPALITRTDGSVWFLETGSLWPGQAMSLQVEQILHHEKSMYQDILVFQSTTYGKVLVLDGVIQVTERDEFAYQEMIAHLPLNAFGQPKHVLVIGGGDGGVLREIVKHGSVESVTLCEIDEAVIRLSKQFFPTLSEGFNHPKVHVHVGDGFEFLEKHQDESFDVIITDSSDPVGPAESLFQPSFYQAVKKALKPNGILCSQGECLWLHPDIILNVLRRLHGLFPVVRYAYTSIPTYPSGQIGFFLCAKDPSTRLENVSADSSLFESATECQELNYYSKEMHKACFVLPAFAERLLQAARKTE